MRTANPDEIADYFDAKAVVKDGLADAETVGTEDYYLLRAGEHLELARAANQRGDYKEEVAERKLANFYQNLYNVLMA